MQSQRDNKEIIELYEGDDSIMKEVIFKKHSYTLWQNRNKIKYLNMYIGKKRYGDNFWEYWKWEIKPDPLNKNLLIKYLFWITTPLFSIIHDQNKWEFILGFHRYYVKFIYNIR